MYKYLRLIFFISYLSVEISFEKVCFFFEEWLMDISESWKYLVYF